MTWFELTMREVKGGAVKGILFDILRKSSSHKICQSIIIGFPICAEIVGVTGDFVMNCDRLNVLWVAGNRSDTILSYA